MPPCKEEALSSTALFRTLPEADRKHLAEVTTIKTFGRGQVIFSEGDPSDFLYTVASGRVKVVKTTPSGKDIIVGIFSNGDPVGAVAVFKERPYPASAVALEDTVCISISRRDLYSLLEQHPSLARGLLLGLTQRLVELIRRVGELTGARVEPRLARLMLRLAREIGRSERGGIFIPLQLSRQELSDMTGTTIETCIRVMSRWEKQGSVRTEGDGFVVMDREHLEILASS